MEIDDIFGVQVDAQFTSVGYRVPAPPPTWRDIVNSDMFVKPMEVPEMYTREQAYALVQREMLESGIVAVHVIDAETADDEEQMYCDVRTVAPVVFQAQVWVDDAGEPADLPHAPTLLEAVDRATSQRKAGL